MQPTATPTIAPSAPITPPTAPAPTSPTPAPTGSSGAFTPAQLQQIVSTAKPTPLGPAQEVAANPSGIGFGQGKFLATEGASLKNIIPNVVGDIKDIGTEAQGSTPQDLAPAGKTFTNPLDASVSKPAPNGDQTKGLETGLEKLTGVGKDVTAIPANVIGGIVGPVLGLVPSIDPTTGKIGTLNSILSSPGYQENTKDLQDTWNHLTANHPVVAKLITNSLGMANNALQTYAGAQGISSAADLASLVKGFTDSENAPVGESAPGGRSAGKTTFTGQDDTEPIIAGPEGSTTPGSTAPGATNPGASQTPYQKGFQFSERGFQFSPSPDADAQATLSARIKDATPSYKESMNYENVMTPEGEIVPRINAEGSGLTGERPVTVSAADQAAGKELANIKDYPSNGTALQKSLSAKLALNDEAEGMRGGLQLEDAKSPLDSKTEIQKVTEAVRSNFPKNIQKIIEDSPKSEPVSDGKPSATKSNDPLKESISKFIEAGQNDEPTFPKTPAGRYYQRVFTALKSFDGSREGILDLRQAVDDGFDANGGKYTHGSDSQAELAETHRDIRNLLNKELSDNTKETDTTASLGRQKNLYHAIDVLNEKAASEAPSALGRFIQKNPVARIVSRTVLRRIIGSVL